MGWQEKDWTGPFYPEGTKIADKLSHYARILPTVEIDSTFYGRPRETTVIAWSDAVPDEFRFALKVPREITHRRRFSEAGQVFSFFIERVRRLGPKLGAILIQCSPDFGPTPTNRQRLFAFLEAELPDDIKVALELRDERWYDDALFRLARDARFALAATEGPHTSLALAERILTEQGEALDFAYLRWMGETELEHYDRVQVDRSASLDTWARLIRELRERVSDVYGYVSDDYAGHAPATVRDLLARLGEPVS
jgi:uncharacterized protein YecE (DUF72 family)